ncbi:MAG: GNAT family N-acetyltransferase [Candidatus Poribacteria bacterium]|nr:GNAT family N-acetyltransferase [Candidatus Poribacteria bacterium]
MIEIITHNHASELISLSGTYLERHESENNLPIGLVYRLSESPHYYGSKSPLLLSILKQEKVVGVAIMTPPRRIILSRIDTEVRVAITHLVHYLRGTNTRTPGVVGPSVEAQAFSDCWIEGAFGVSARVAMRLRVFEARKVADMSLSPGKLRLARPDDQPLMAKWIAKFSEEIREPVDLESAKSHAERSIKEQELYVWDNGAPVCIAREARPTRNGTTINTVYTPPEHRNKGYATACVWSLTQRMLTDRYSFCSLYTDLSNPTSNSIYTKIGYAPVGDALTVDFQSNRDRRKT